MRAIRRDLACLVLSLAPIAVACGSGRGGFEPEAIDGSAPPATSPLADAGLTGTFGGDGAPAEAGPCQDVVDVVFALDVSSSMDFVLDKLDAEIDRVVAAANTLAKDAHFGLIAFVDNYALDATGALEGGKVHTGAASLKAAFATYKTVYTYPNRNPADGPGGPTDQNPICEENANDALHAAASEFPWRPNATRVVIVVTDDTFLERPDNYGDRDGDGKTDKTNYPREGNYPAAFTMTETIDALKGARARVFAFTKLVAPTGFTRCGTGRRLPWSSVSDGWSTPYKGAAPIPQRTGGKNFDLDKVKSGAISLSETINQVVIDSYCNPPPK
jgi:hypothetical protein